MILARAVLVIAGIVLLAGPAHAQPRSAHEAFEEWLAAINSGDKALIEGWYADRLGIPDAAFAVGMAEDACGFDLVRVESQSPETISVLVAERCFPALRRVEVETDPAGSARLKAFRARSFALPDKVASNAIGGIANRLARKDEFAGSLLLVRGGERLLARAWGDLDEAGDTPISPDTPMFLASAGKMFTALAVLQLVEAGRIELDAPLARYLPDYPNSATAQVTIRQLLQHRDGTGDLGILARGDAANRARVRTIDDLLALNGNRPPAFAPGSRSEYDNYGFVLLGAVVERVSGESYYDYVARHIFAPAGMDRAGFPDLEHLAGVATGYTTFYGEEPRLVSHREVLPWRGTPAGGGVASANDLLKFFDALRSGRLVSPATLKLATTGDEVGWGLGFVVNTGEAASFGHGGGSYGMDVAAHHYTGVDTTFICIASRDSACNRLIGAWFNRVFGLKE